MSFTQKQAAMLAGKKTAGRRNASSAGNALRRANMRTMAQALTRTGGRLPATAGELKNVDTAITTPAFGVATASITPLNLIPQDSTANGRVGRRVIMKSIYIRGSISMAATSTGATSFRVRVVYDKQANATLATAVQVYQTDSVSSMNQLDNSRRFVTLFDEIRSCIGTAGPQALYFEMYKKINLPIEFNAGTTAVIGSLVTGAVVALVSTGGGVGVASLNSALNCRIRYADA